MNMFINTAYENIEIFIFKEGYSKLYKKKSINNHTIVLYELFNEMLTLENLNTNDINKIYIVNGPGSFTGLRVGVVFAKTLAYELKKELVPVDYLKILYLTLNKKIALDARGKKYFCYDGETFSIKTIEQTQADNYVIDNNINYSNLIENLKTFKKKNILEIVVDYKKEVI